jgi:hypothetical protein
LCDDLTGSIVFAMLVNEVHAHKVDWLSVVGFGHDCLTLNRNTPFNTMKNAEIFCRHLLLHVCASPRFGMMHSN